LWITRELFCVGDWIGTKVITSASGRHVYRILLESLSLLFVLVFFFYSFRLTVLAQDVTNVFAIPKRILYACMPIAGAVMVAYSIGNIIREMLPLLRPSIDQLESENQTSDA
jgi:TRAP-type C4-dicarboxylate transport system permease small subunit